MNITNVTTIASFFSKFMLNKCCPFLKNAVLSSSKCLYRQSLTGLRKNEIFTHPQENNITQDRSTLPINDTENRKIFFPKHNSLIFLQNQNRTGTIIQF